MRLPKPIPEWRQCYKFWSIRLHTASIVILGTLYAFPEAIAHVWLILPAEIHNTIPESVLKWIGYGCLAAGTLARIVRQDSIHKDPSLGPEGERRISE